MCLDVHEKNLVQLYLTDDVSTTLTLAKLVCVVLTIEQWDVIPSVVVCVLFMMCCGRIY